MPKKKVAYFYDQDIGGFYYGSGHPMKPHRIRLTHALVLSYGIANELDMYKIKKATPADLQKFHNEDYIKFLQKVTPANRDKMNALCKQFNVGEDCPAFDGLFDYCRTYAGGSIAGAIKLNYGGADVVINWAGGLHHAKKGEASGFCYVNDIVLGILELLKYHKRVLYVDIDIHHGDGVEEAFLTTDRVFTVSFHKFGNSFFPGTGDITHIGQGKGKYYALNVPLKDGIDDASYEYLFKPILDKVMEVFQPEAIVLQSGADSLAGDRLGCFNLSMKGHAACQQHVLSYNKPTLVVGGGGYKISNTARCWAYETGRIVGADLGEHLPDTEYQEYFGTTSLQIPVKEDLENQNTREYLDSIRTKALQNLSMLGSAPGVPFEERPQDAMDIDEIEPDKKAGPAPPRLWDGMRTNGARVDISYRNSEEDAMTGQPGRSGSEAVSVGGAPVADMQGVSVGNPFKKLSPKPTLPSVRNPPPGDPVQLLPAGLGNGLSNGTGPPPPAAQEGPPGLPQQLGTWPMAAPVQPVANS